MVILFALLINPYGLNGVLSAFTVLSKYGYTIVENQSWLFLRDFGFPLVAHIFFGFTILTLSYLVTLRRLRKPLLGEIVLLLAVSLLTLRFVRNEILFAYTAFLTTAFNFARLARLGESRRGGSGLIVSLVCLVVSGWFIAASHANLGLPIGFDSRESYKSGVDFFLAKNLQGPIFNNFDIGGYLIYRLYPRVHVFVDNRPEAYPVAFFEDVYKQMQFDPKVFKKYEEQYNLKTIIWGKRDITPWSYAFLEHIAQNREWGQVYDDGAIIIYVKKP